MSKTIKRRWIKDLEKNWIPWVENVVVIRKGVDRKKWRQDWRIQKIFRPVCFKQLIVGCLDLNFSIRMWSWQDYLIVSFD